MSKKHLIHLGFRSAQGEREIANEDSQAEGPHQMIFCQRVWSRWPQKRNAVTGTGVPAQIADWHARSDFGPEVEPFSLLSSSWGCRVLSLILYGSFKRGIGQGSCYPNAIDLIFRGFAYDETGGGADPDSVRGRDIFLNVW